MSPVMASQIYCQAAMRVPEVGRNLVLTTHAGIPLMSSLAEVLVLSLLDDLKCQRAYDCTAFQVAIAT